jgi:hypothetical protein
MMKVIEPPPAPDSNAARLNRRLLNARRLIEMLFGRLKGRWVFCSKNTFWSSVDFTRQAIEVCCGLHNFLEERDVEMPVDEDENDDALAVPHEAPAAGAGAVVRDHLVQWVGEH